MSSEADQLGFVVLTAHMSLDLAEVARVLQLLVRQPIQIDRFNAHLAPADVSKVEGLELVTGPVT